MSEEQQQPDAVVNETVAPQEESTATQETQTEKPASKSESSKKDQEYNWRRMREAMEELQQQNRLLHTRLEEKNDDLDEVDKLADDDLLTKAQTKRLASKAAKKAAEEATRQIVKQRDLETLDDRVRLRYPDYTAVVTPENLEDLKSDPLFVKSLKGLQDPYDQAAFVYEQLKLRGRTSHETLEKKQLEQNAAKPRSQQSLGGASPLHSANQYANWPDPALQKQLWKEMQEAAKGA